MYTIEEMKLTMVNGTTQDFLDTLPEYDIKSIDKFGNNILHYFIKLCANSAPTTIARDWKLVIDSLINSAIGIEEKQTKGNGCSPLHLSVLCHLKDITDYLINLGADINSIDTYGKHILETAILSNDLSSIDWFIQKLIDSGADTSLITPNGKTIKELALSISNYDYSKYFLD